MDHKITKFGLNKSKAIKFIFELQQLVDGHIKIKNDGICGNIQYVIGFGIDFESIFSVLGCDNLVFPVGGHVEYDNTENLWVGESLVKRVALCKRIIVLMQKTFNLENKLWVVV